MNTGIAAVIPSYRVAAQVEDVVAAALQHVDHVFCVDDACPEHSGDRVETQFAGRPVTVLRHAENRGVGGAMKTGYRAALEAGYEIVVKLDGDGQMDAALIPVFTRPLREGRADYAKGNRFFELGFLQSMPRLRLFGNAVLSLMSKVSSGYWQVLDPTNGYTAIHSAALSAIPLDKLAERYFFESDLLFRLSVARAVVIDVPMAARYGDEQSGLSIPRIIGPFLFGHLRNGLKRIAYTYFLRDFNIATLELVTGLALGGFGTVFGLSAWLDSHASGITASAGTVMLAGLTFLIGVQMLLAFLNYDIRNVPREPLSSFLPESQRD